MGVTSSAMRRSGPVLSFSPLETVGRRIKSAESPGFLRRRDPRVQQFGGFSIASERDMDCSSTVRNGKVGRDPRLTAAGVRCFHFRASVALFRDDQRLAVLAEGGLAVRQNQHTGTSAFTHRGRPNQPWASMSPPPPLPPRQRRVVGCERAEEVALVGIWCRSPSSELLYSSDGRLQLGWPAFSRIGSLEQPPCRARFEGGRRSHRFVVHKCGKAW